MNEIVGGKTWTENQHWLADQLVAVYDTTDGYMFRKRFGMTQTLTPVAVGLGGAAFTVPATEAWFVEAFSAQATVIVAATLQLGLMISEPGISGTLFGTRSYGENVSPLMPANMLATVSFHPRRWYGPGTSLNLVVVQATGIGAGQATDCYAAVIRNSL